ncbi:MAG: flavoprotein [Planctomycetota bacterium]|jgi:phosphopantothenoylcysteine decarboxylase/phosphopantothenate--cysteine ligase
MTAAKDKSLDGFTTLLCVTGGIACYKAADLASKLTQAGAAVPVAMTDAAQRFITPLTFQSLTGRDVTTSLWDAEEAYEINHTALADRIDLMIVAPATANILAKIATGIADDLVSTVALATSGACEMLVAPAMNSRMWLAPATQVNMATLSGRGVRVVGPAEGRMACGTVGPGRMAEPADIFDAVVEMLAGKTPRRT